MNFFFFTNQINFKFKKNQIDRMLDKKKFEFHGWNAR